MNKEVLIKVEGVSKKYCKDLKKSLQYGLYDLFKPVFFGSKKKGLRNHEFWAVKEVSFELKRGECLGLIGHNGAGKSTLLKMLNGLIKPDEGSIEMRGRVGALIELGAGFNPILTGRENIYNNGAILGLSKKEIDNKIDKIIEFSEIGDFIDSPVQNYSSGMKVRLGFAVASQMEPDILIIDEVLAVGDVGFKIKCLNRISELLDRCAVIFVSHSMTQVAKVCTHGMLLDHGKTKYESEQVQNVITEYFKLFQNSESSTQGTGQASFSNLIVENYSEKTDNRFVFQQSNDVKLNFELTISSEIKKFYVGLSFLDIEQKLVAVANNVQDGIVLINDKEKHHISISVPNLFSSLSYSVTLGVFEVKDYNDPVSLGKLLLRKSDFISFINQGVKLPSYTPIQLSANWEFK
ncbi:ABC transporter ATP-binding protein [Mangrovimonas sp. ST2L15]|uniref:ABC transporter ATP-binding protein n=1 Tax=Mangrovimonas sp. ST2L15 TaxID=1645916 RepID=UPI0006B40356|nr:ABC transporter ATP-binding protein [Mangrovimonas sp. ST2L15]